MRKMLIAMLALFALLAANNLYPAEKAEKKAAKKTAAAAEKAEVKPFAFRDYTWDTDVSEVLKGKNVVEVIDKSPGASPFWRKDSAQEKDRIAGLDCIISYLFDPSGKLKLVSISFFNVLENNIEAIRSMYVRKYGKPHKTVDKDKETGIVTLSWDVGTADIEMKIHSAKSKIVRSNFYVSVDYKRKQTEAEKKTEKEEAEKDAEKI